MNDTGTSKADATCREQAVSLFQYLAELVELRSKMTRDVASYEEALWFSDVPHERECFTPAWAEVEESGDDTWLRIDKPRKPEVPAPPGQCEYWFDREQLNDPKNEPILKDEISDPNWTDHTVIRSAEEDPHADDEDEVSESMPPKLRLEDYPEITTAWQKYLRESWRPWRDEHRRWERVQRVYRTLFRIHQRQKKLGEQLELVLGLGTLVWRAANGDRIRRPILTAPATVVMEAHSGSFVVSPPAEGTQFSLEQDMLEADERPPVDEQRHHEQVAEQLASPWERETVMRLLRGWVHALSPEAAFSEGLGCPREARAQPQMAFAPILVLRKRGQRTMLTALKTIVGQLKEGRAIPRIIQEFCSADGDRRSLNDRYDTIAEPGDALLFPKPSNDEQREIIYRLAGRAGVLVQGPPGTGKSHTIANLVCHFLAHGKRVLVTSQTPRALKVLRKQIPDEVRALSVSVLGNDKESFDNLEESVEGILHKVNYWNARQADEEIASLIKKMEFLRAELADLRRLQRELREAETTHHYVPGTSYSGTAQAIAQAVAKDRPEFGWIEDRIADNVEAPLSESEFRELYQLRAEYGEHARDILEGDLPDLDRLPTADQLKDAHDALVAATEAAEHNEQMMRRPRVKPLAQLDEAKVNRLEELCRSCLDIQESLQRRIEPWVQQAKREVLAGHDQPWAELAVVTRKAVEELKRGAAVSDPQEFELPRDISRAQLLADATDLLEHLKSGGKMRVWGVRPPVVKRCKYLWKTYRFNGRLCDKPAVLEQLVTYVGRLNHLDGAWQEWTPYTASPPTGTFRSRLARLQEYLEALEMTLQIPRQAKEAERIIQRAGLADVALQGEGWAGELLEEVAAATAHRRLERARRDYEHFKEAIDRLLSFTRPHVLILELRQSAERRKWDRYRAKRGAVAELQAKRANVQRLLDLDQRLREAAPKLAGAFASDDHRPCLASRVDHFLQAWAWRRASAWLERYAREHDERTLPAEIEQKEATLAKVIESLAALKAWKACVERLTGEQQRALQAWKLAVKKIGKGTGKHAQTYRRDARKNMAKCRSAIPAWTLPLYRVAESIDIQPEAFDVVIVDEASQTGPEGLILQYLAKQCIIVGDDKQISPDAVGIDIGAARSLRQKHLQGIQFDDTLGPRDSLFDQGAVRFGNRISLREHFRCVPEIIQFSNNLCYQKSPLIPLRQYPPDRLAPIVVRHVIDGYREGHGDRTVNRPEAAAVAQAVVHCLSDRRYDGKTMGVISLQGHAQPKLIEHYLLEQVGPDPFEERQLVCGDAYSFQGDERDIMFLSMVAAVEGGSRLTALTRLAFQQRFNVAASRARDQMWLFHSVRASDLNPECMRRRLLEYCYAPASVLVDMDLSKCESQFERDVATELRQRGFRVVPQFDVAGKRIDLVVEGARSRLAIECDGDEWHGPERYEDDMARQRQLEGRGWKFVRVRGSAFYANRAEAIRCILDALAERGIEPHVHVGDGPDTTVDKAEVRGAECLNALKAPPPEPDNDEAEAGAASL